MRKEMALLCTGLVSGWLLRPSFNILFALICFFGGVGATTLYYEYEVPNRLDRFFNQQP
jgi:hypothetical protein